jgi:ABC-type lipoprotein export system ATPase subunit
VTQDLRCEDLSYRIGDKSVLRGINAQFASGEIAVISGPTGSGKSTLLHLLGGLRRPTEGAVFAGGHAVSRWTAAHRDRWRRKVGITLQSPHLLPGLSVLENVIIPLVPRDFSTSVLQQKGAAALAQLGIGELAGELAVAVSGGEQQRTALARALAMEPAYLLVDEPTAHQDTQGVGLVTEALVQAKKRGTVVVVATHDPRLTQADLGDRRWVLEDGQLKCSIH